MGLSRTVSEIDGDFRWILQNFPTPCILAQQKGFPLELGTSAGGQKTRMMATRPRKKFDDIFSHLDTMHQRDRRTDGRTDRQTPGYSKDHAYAWRRAVKTKAPPKQ